LPNLPHYIMNPTEHVELQRHVEELLDNKFIIESLSPCVILVLLAPKKDGRWRMCVDSRAINKITVKYHFPISTLDDMLDLISGATIFFKIDLKSGFTKLEFGQGTNEKLHLKLKMGCMNGWLCPLDCSMLLAPL